MKAPPSDPPELPAFHQWCEGEPWDGFDLTGLFSRTFSFIQKEKGQPLLIAIGGPGGTGKSTFAENLHLNLGHNSSLLTLDDYKTPRQERSDRGIFGAHPDANKMNLIKEHLIELSKGRDIQKPLYDSVTGTVEDEIILPSRPIVIIDGEISTYEHFRDQIHLSIFIDAHWRTQLQTRLSRDIEIRQYSPEKAIETFLQSNLREFKTFGAQSIEWCDILIWCQNNYQLSLKSMHPKWVPTFEQILFEDD